MLRNGRRESLGAIAVGFGHSVVLTMNVANFRPPIHIVLHTFVDRTAGMKRVVRIYLNVWPFAVDFSCDTFET